MYWNRPRRPLVAPRERSASRVRNTPGRPRCWKPWSHAAVLPSRPSKARC